MCYGIVAISAQVQLQEDIPADVRGRVFGVLNMLISVASILPIIVVGPIADIPGVGTTVVILVVAGLVLRVRHLLDDQARPDPGRTRCRT